MRKLASITACALFFAACTGGEPEATDTGSAGGLAEGQQAPTAQGRPIGTVTARGDLVILELDEGVIAEANLFDLEGRTLRFTPADGGYRVQNLSLEWNPDFGPETDGNQAVAIGFEFPFSGRGWSSVNVGNGTLAFSEASPEQAGRAQGRGAAGHGRGGQGRGTGGAAAFEVTVGRFDELREAAPNLVNTVPAISVFLKPRSSGSRYAKTVDRRLVVTWDVVTGLGEREARRRQPQQFCSDGRIQSTYIQPVWVASDQAMESPPDGSWDNDNYAMSQIPHELGHRWVGRTRAIVDGDTIDIGATHWAAGLHVEVPYSYSGDPEASMMGGGNWQGNADGTYTRLADAFYVPASGPSYLDLYLMGMLAVDDVPDFFFVQDMEATGEADANGNPIYTGERVDLTVEDVIAYNGPRLPPADKAQREFSTAMVAVVLPGQSPGPELLERLEGMRQAWVNHWSVTTGGISRMSTSLRD